MVDEIEMTLHDIIKTSRKPRRRGGRRGGRSRGGGGESRGDEGVSRRNFRSSGQSAATSGVRGRGGRGGISRKISRGDVNRAWKHNLFEGYDPRKVVARKVVLAAMEPTRLILSNLDFGIEDSDIQELFAEFGTLRIVAVHYDRSGHSLGTAIVMFDRKIDALKAMRQYDGVPLDGRAMAIQLTTSEISSPMGKHVGKSEIEDKSPRREAPKASRGRGSGRTERNKQRNQPATKESTRN